MSKLDTAFFQPYQLTTLLSSRTSRTSHRGALDAQQIA